MSQLDYNNMLVAELKQELESIGLPTSGIILLLCDLLAGNLTLILMLSPRSTITRTLSP